MFIALVDWTDLFDTVLPESEVRSSSILSVVLSISYTPLKKRKSVQGGRPFPRGSCSLQRRIRNP
jgi:hypothetical protein